MSGMESTPGRSEAVTASERARARLAAEMARTGTTKEQLAAHLGVHRITVSRYLSGHTAMGLETLEAAADLLGCDPSVFIAKSDEAVA